MNYPAINNKKNGKSFKNKTSCINNKSILSQIYRLIYQITIFQYKKIIVKNIPHTEEKLNVLKHDLKNKINNIDELKLFSYN